MKSRRKLQQFLPPKCLMRSYGESSQVKRSRQSPTFKLQSRILSYLPSIGSKMIQIASSITWRCISNHSECNASLFSSTNSPMSAWAKACMSKNIVATDDLVSQLAGIDHKVEEMELMYMILNNLPSSWDPKSKFPQLCHSIFFLVFFPLNLNFPEDS